MVYIFSYIYDMYKLRFCKSCNLYKQFTLIKFFGLVNPEIRIIEGRIFEVLLYLIFLLVSCMSDFFFFFFWGGGAKKDNFSTSNRLSFLTQHHISYFKIGLKLKCITPKTAQVFVLHHRETKL